MYKYNYKSRFGGIGIRATDKGIVGISFNDRVDESGNDEHPLLQQCRRELDEYFEGKRKKFTVPLVLEGTDFQKRVWKSLTEIPYGRTVSYGDIARAVGNGRSARAVGGACGSNPVPIVIPCHRVIGSNGNLTGFGGRLDLKQRLLDHEKTDKK